jgi:uncharacterized protein
MRVVLDSNVLVAAFAAQGLCHSLFEQCLANHMIFVSTQILEEVEKALLQKIKLPASTTRETIVYLRAHPHSATPSRIPKGSCRDPKDEPIVGLAVAAGAGCLVSGDNDLLAMKSYEGVPILSPRDFYTLLQSQSK